MELIMIKILTYRILIAVVCLSVLFLGCIEEENHKTELSIDTPEEAIGYAKTDNCTREWIEAWSELGYGIKEDASVDNQSIWHVRFEADVYPILEQPFHNINMHSNGTILSRFGGAI
ncbi:MAG: hypothetical protein ACNYWM_06170 [Methanosarcinales archaeon]